MARSWILISGFWSSGLMALERVNLRVLSAEDPSFGEYSFSLSMRRIGKA